MHREQLGAAARDQFVGQLTRAALRTARAQPPPIQPSEILPSGKFTAFVIALAAVATRQGNWVRFVKMIPRSSCARVSFAADADLTKRSQFFPHRRALNVRPLIEVCCPNMLSSRRMLAAKQ
jgi:hypothetical protein